MGGETVGEAVLRWARQVLAVENLHTERRFSGDGYGWTVCAECRQTWPCATQKAMDAAATDG